MGKLSFGLMGEGRRMVKQKNDWSLAFRGDRKGGRQTQIERERERGTERERARERERERGLRVGSGVQGGRDANEKVEG